MERGSHVNEQNGKEDTSEQMKIDQLLEIQLNTDQKSPIEKYIDLDEIDVNPLDLYRYSNLSLNNHQNANMNNTNANLINNFDEFRFQFSVGSSTSSSVFSEPSNMSTCSGNTISNGTNNKSYNNNNNNHFQSNSCLNHKINIIDSLNDSFGFNQHHNHTQLNLEFDPISTFGSSHYNKNNVNFLSQDQLGTAAQPNQQIKLLNENDWITSFTNSMHTSSHTTSPSTAENMKTNSMPNAENQMIYCENFATNGANSSNSSNNNNNNNANNCSNPSMSNFFYLNDLIKLET